MLKDTLEETMEKSMKLENLERISMLFPDMRKQKKDDSFEYTVRKGDFLL